MLFHHSLEDAEKHLQICMLPCFCSKSFRQLFICDFPKSGWQFEQVQWLPLPAFIWLLIATTRLLVTADGKGLPEMILPQKYRPSWSMIYKCEYIYIHINSLHLYGVYMCFNIEKWLCCQNTGQDTLQAKTGCEYSQ